MGREARASTGKLGGRLEAGHDDRRIRARVWPDWAAVAAARTITQADGPGAECCDYGFELRVPVVAAAPGAPWG